MVSVTGGRVVVVAGLIVSLLTGGLRAADPGATKNNDDALGRSITLARLDEIAAIAQVMAEHTWPGFDPLTYPAVFYEPGGWVLAIGFPEPPPGFTVVTQNGEATRHRGRPLYRSTPGVFQHQGRSPALVQGKWTVISTFDPPETLPTGARMGRVAGEEALGRFFGDAFAIFLMEQRKTSTPFVTGAAAYPESAELMALTTLEQRAVTAPLQMTNISERNIDQFHRYVRTVVAIRHARWKLMGEELAAIERDVELTEGLRLFTATMVHRHALNGMLVSTDPGKNDGTFVSWVNSTAMRSLGMGYPMFFTLDNPAVTLPQVAVRAAVLGALLDKVAVPWRPAALAGEFALIDLLAQTEKVTPQDEPGLIDAAKQSYNYEPLLNLARADLVRLGTDREAWLRQFLPNGLRHLEIVLPAGEVATYADDPWSTRHLGVGRLSHPGGLTLKTAGLELETSGAAQGAEGSVLTEAGVSRRQLRRVHVVLPPDAPLKLAGKSYRASEKPRQLTDMAPLVLEVPGLRMRITGGSVAMTADGALQVVIVH